MCPGLRLSWAILFSRFLLSSLGLVRGSAPPCNTLLCIPPGRQGPSPSPSPACLRVCLGGHAFSRAPCSPSGASPKASHTFCSSPFPLPSPPGVCTPLDGFAAPNQPPHTRGVQLDCFHPLTQADIYGCMCQGEPEERWEEVGKGIAHHKHPWDKVFFICKNNGG